MSVSKSICNARSDDALEQAMSSVASAISDASRVSILCALMDGRAWTATELSAVAGITASTTSGHLARLLNNGLIRCLSQGRHRYYSLAGPQIAGLLENLMSVSMSPPTPPASRTPQHLRYARTCYDHLAGELAVEIYQLMQQEQWLEADGSMLTAAGKSRLQSLGCALDPRPRRRACCPCLDWSERRFHLGGDAGAALMTLFLQKAWIERIQGYREVKVTSSGKIALRRHFHLNVC
ncbi:transcriptional regulator [Izhakiella australiensis]|uniref:Transcriptional regulator n=1 Tax=Izhakiella australiensis TaxID=1926881 RepID=A0A1S8YNH7_9GAMM|nr:winged helix-turn-helix domain-containing protein [Izhakiella australiensis]OON40711.1 transcriptional regulator [Izhakiella australiensis]